MLLAGGVDSAGRVHDELWTLAAAAGASSSAPQSGRVPPPLSRADVYAADRPGRLAPQVRQDPARVYVPNSRSDTVDVIDQRTSGIVDHFAVGALPQHVTPSWTCGRYGLPTTSVTR